MWAYIRVKTRPLQLYAQSPSKPKPREQCRILAIYTTMLYTSRGFTWFYTHYTHAYCMHIDSLDSRPRRERRPGILCMRMREMIDNNFIIQIVKTGQSYKKEEYV